MTRSDSKIRGGNFRYFERYDRQFKMSVQKPVFMAWYAAEAAGTGLGGWMDVLWHGLTLDGTVAGYVTALPLLLALVSLWVRLPGRIWRRVLTGYFVLVATVTAVIFAVDV